MGRIELFYQKYLRNWHYLGKLQNKNMRMFEGWVIQYIFIWLRIKFHNSNVFREKQPLWQTNFLGKEICWVPFFIISEIWANSIGTKTGPISEISSPNLSNTIAKYLMLEQETLSWAKKCIRKATEILPTSISLK